MTALRTRLGLEALSGERRALVEARLDDLYESRGGDRAWAEAAEGERPRRRDRGSGLCGESTSELGSCCRRYTGIEQTQLRGQRRVDGWGV